ncbi:MAG: dihydroneopterin aldolase [Hyphomonadaceae bacterium]
MSEPSSVSIFMRDVELRVRIGEHAWEKDDAQRLRLDLSLHFSLNAYNADHGRYVNYDPLRMYLNDIESRPHTERIETLARDILTACFEMTPAERVELTIMKPDIFPEMKGVGLHYDVARSDFVG